MFRSIDYVEVFLVLYLIILIIMPLFIFLSIWRRHHRNRKKLEFTQRIIEQNQEVKKVLRKLIIENSRGLYPAKKYNNYVSEPSVFKYQEEKEEYIKDTYLVLNFFSTLADGINRGIYDENLIRVNFEQELKLFYRISGPYIRSLRFDLESDEMFLPIEFLLKEWNIPAKKRVTYFG